MKLTVAGSINAGGFWKARRAALHILADDAEVDEVDLQPLLPADFAAFLLNARKVLGGSAWQHTASVLVFTSGEGGYIGDSDAMGKWAFTRSRFIDNEPESAYEAYALDAYRSHISSSPEVFVELTLVSKGEAFGNLVFRLARETAPQTCAHFLAMMDKPGSEVESSPYIGSAWHRVASGAFAMCGVLTEDKLAQVDSSFSSTQLADESFAISHEKAFVLGFANSGPHSQSSQFYVTLAPLRTLDGRFVAFGHLADGFETLSKLSEVPTVSEVPVDPITIASARVFQP